MNAPRKGPLIQTQNLRLSQAGRVVLDHVTFEIALGEIVTIVGPNGSGKTSLLRALIGALQPERGIITRAENLRIGYRSDEVV